MAPPPIHLFLTTIASQPALRQRQEYLLRVLQVKKIPFSSYDLASDEDAKKLWRRKAPADKQQLPGILIGGKFPGTFADFEDAVECGELDAFLRRNETYKESEFERPAPEIKPVGVPGAYSPSQMHPKYTPSPSPSPSPLKAKPKGRVSSTGNLLSDHGLHDLDVSEDDLAALVRELGLGGDDAKDLVKGLGIESTSRVSKEKAGSTETKSDAGEQTSTVEASRKGKPDVTEEIVAEEIKEVPSVTVTEDDLNEPPTKED